MMAICYIGSDLPGEADEYFIRKPENQINQVQLVRSHGNQLFPAH